jgi:archaemetzincin
MMHRLLALVIGLCATASAAAQAPPTPPTTADTPPTVGTPPTVCLQPLGPHDPTLLAAVAAGITHLYGTPTEVLDPKPLPPAAYYAPRKRWRAERLLDYMDAEVAPSSPQCTYIMGFTSQDISTTKDAFEDWGVLGLGSLGGPSAVISSFRLHKRLSSQDKAARANQITSRAIKVANHELGHVLGLPHDDSTPGCLMNDAHGSILTVDAETGLHCPNAQSWIESHHHWRMP